MTDTPPSLPPTTPPPVPSVPRTSGMAIASFICAVVPAFPVTQIAALVLASKANKEIHASNGALTGGGLATAGKIISICFLVGFTGIIALAALATPAILKQRKKMEMTQALSSSKSIYMVMMDYEYDMGSFPDDHTAQENADLNEFQGTSSNKYLGQLIAGGYTKSEEIFSIRSSMRSRADDIISPPSEILKKGENGWAYVLVDDQTEEPSIRGLSTADQGDLPILVAPLDSADGAIKRGPFDSKAVILRIDGSARHERFSNVAKTPLDSPSWNEKFRPVVKMPE